MKKLMENWNKFVGEELASLGEGHPDYGPENEPPRGTPAHQIWSRMQCNCKEPIKDVAAAEAGQGRPDIVAANVKRTKERCPECFREDEKTTQEPEAAMGPEGPIMKKTFQERNKMTTARLEEIVKKELEAIVKKQEHTNEDH